MAIFGSFEEIPPPEALCSISSDIHGTGVFIANVPPAHHFEIFLRAGSITGFREDGVLLDDIMRLHDRFTDLLLMRMGDFEFRRLPNVRVEGSFHVPLDQMVVRGLACAEELNTAPELLPSEETVFELDQEKEFWLGEELQLFWERAMSPLASGACAANSLSWSTPRPRKLSGTFTNSAWPAWFGPAAACARPCRRPGE